MPAVLSLFTQAPLALQIVAVVGLAVLVRSTYGFGDALVAMPLLLLIGQESTDAVALVALVSLLTAAGIFLFNREQVDWSRDTRVLCAAAVPGLLLGLWFLESVPPPVLTSVLGVTVVAVGLLGLFANPVRWRLATRSAAGLGLLAGFLGGAFNVHGPPLVVYGTARDWPPEKFRATLQAYFLAAGLLLVIGHGVAGHYQPKLVSQFCNCLPAIAVSTWLGGQLNRRLPVSQFRLGVFVILIMLGTVLMLKDMLD